MSAALKKLSTTELAQVFAGFAIQQYDHMLVCEVKQVNRLYHKMKAVEMELKSRPGDQRSVLMALYDHSNPNVRVKAAKATLAIAPTAARQVLETVCATCYGPEILEAGMSLTNLDRGIYKPT
jgi:cytochrome c oxidase assembly protein Cox11